MPSERPETSPGSSPDSVPCGQEGGATAGATARAPGSSAAAGDAPVGQAWVTSGNLWALAGAWAKEGAFLALGACGKPRGYGQGLHTRTWAIPVLAVGSAGAQTRKGR